MINIAFFWDKKKKSIVNQLHSDFYLEKLVNNEISKFIVQNQPLSQWMKDSQKRKKKKKKEKEKCKWMKKYIK